MRHWADEDTDDGEGSEPWALGDDEAEPLVRWDDDEDGADPWLDEQLAGLRPLAASDAAAGTDGDRPCAAGAAGVVLRRPAPGRTLRRRRADPDAAGDLPDRRMPGYVRDRRGTWRYEATGQAVPGARDLTLRSLYRFTVQRGHMLVPADLARTEAELAWCLAWKSRLTTRLSGRRSITVLRIPVTEWERRADIPFGLWAPELTASRLLGIADVARLLGVSPATVSAYLARRRMPEPVMRLGQTPVWSRPIITQWLTNRPGQGARPRNGEPARRR